MTPQMTNIAKHILKEEMFRDYCQLHAHESKYRFSSVNNLLMHIFRPLYKSK